MSDDSTTKTTGDKAEAVLFRTIDPTVNLDGRPIPAMTTMLHRVCGNDDDRFQEAMRLVELFIIEALS